MEGKKEAVTNSSSIIFIAKLNKFNLMKNIFKEVLIPSEVVKELLQKESSENISIIHEMKGFLKETNPVKIVEYALGAGEKSAISLCLEKKGRFFISDDRKARGYARRMGIETIGVIGIILENLERSMIDKNEAKSLVNRLIKKGYYMSTLFYSRTMETIESL